MKMPSIKEFQSLLVISILLAITGIWIPFLHLFMLNYSNLTLPLSVHLPNLGKLSAIIIGAALVLQVLTPFRWRNITSLVLLFLGIFFWAEGTLLIGDFGFLQGHDMDWGKNQYLLYLELLLVVCYGFLAFWLKGKLVQKSALVLLFVLISSFANLYPAMQTYMARNKSQPKNTFTQEGVFRIYSKHHYRKSLRQFYSFSRIPGRSLSYQKRTQDFEEAWL